MTRVGLPDSSSSSLSAVYICTQHSTSACVPHHAVKKHTDYRTAYYIKQKCKGEAPEELIQASIAVRDTMQRIETTTRRSKNIALQQQNTRGEQYIAQAPVISTLFTSGMMRAKCLPRHVAFGVPTSSRVATA